ncbi:MAG: response regulator [Fuscovulum sp.]|nr:response regulator [Fuscovulum sp.]
MQQHIPSPVLIPKAPLAAGPTGDELRTELDRQRQALLRDLPERFLLSTLAFGLCALFANPWVIGALWLVHTLADLATPALLRADRMLASRAGYAAGVLHSTILETTYISAAGLVWFGDNPYAKAFAVGLVALSFLHLAIMRSIHLPGGLAGLAASAVTLFSFNAVFWWQQADMTGLAMSCVIAVGGYAYALTAMLSNNLLNRTMARGLAAARAAHEAKSVFLAQMSHELRTPLNAVIGMAQAALADTDRRCPANAETHERMQLLADSARAMSVILDDVTDMNALANGRLPLRDRTICLGDELCAILSGFGKRAERLGIPLTLDSATPLPDRVSLDAVRLRQCLTNLLTNALRHAPGCAVHVACNALPAPEGNGGLLLIDVSDTGPGVPEDQRERIFEAFHRGHTGAPGTGLGLAIARSLARAMGGDLQLLPSAQGAAFRLSLRYSLPPAVSADEAPLPDLTGHSILVVDDIDSNRLVARTYLRGWGAHVVDAADGETALAIMAAEDVDLILLDMNMPGIDGFETTRRARLMGGRMSALPIVAMTAEVTEDRVRAFREVGCDGHVPKPVLPERLAEELRRLLTLD